MARSLSLIAVAPLVLALSGCGSKASQRTETRPPDQLEAVSLEGFRAHEFIVQTKGIPSQGSAGNTVNERLTYTLHRDQENVVAQLQSLRYPEFELRRGADVSRLMHFAKQPRKVMQAAVDKTFQTPYSRFQIDKRGQDFNHKIVAHRESILIIGNNAAGVISLFLAPRRIDDATWSRTIEMPTNDGVVFRGDLHYKVLRDESQQTALVNVIVSGSLTADGAVELVVEDDMPVAFGERRAAKRRAARVDQSHWSFKGVLRYSRDFQQWASGSVRTDISMRIHTQEGVTIRESTYTMELVGSSPRSNEKKTTAP